MSFRYIARTPDGIVHTATTPEQFDALLDRLLAEFPDGEIELDAIVDDGSTPTPKTETISAK